MLFYSCFILKGGEEFFVEINNITDTNSTINGSHSYNLASSISNTYEYSINSRNYADTASINNSISYDSFNYYNYTGLVCSSSTQNIFNNNYINIHAYYENIYYSNSTDSQIIHLSLRDFDPIRNTILLTGTMTSKLLIIILFYMKLGIKIQFIIQLACNNNC